VRDQAVAAWSLVHGLTMLLIDDQLSATGRRDGDTEGYARAAARTLVEGTQGVSFPPASQSKQNGGPEGRRQELLETGVIAGPLACSP
jgi:hypothetical protein